MQILKRFIEPALNEKVIFVYSKNSESQKMMSDMFDLDKLWSPHLEEETHLTSISRKVCRENEKARWIKGMLQAHKSQHIFLLTMNGIELRVKVHWGLDQWDWYLVFTSRGTEPLKPRNVIRYHIIIYIILIQQVNSKNVCVVTHEYIFHKPKKVHAL
jgi:hypothetical protein